jgi:hypothetical protein
MEVQWPKLLPKVNYKLMPTKVLAAFVTWSVYAHLRAGRAILRDWNMEFNGTAT